MEVFAVLIRHLLLKRCELAALAVFRKLVLGSDEKRPGIFILALELGPFYPFHDPEYQAAGKEDEYKRQGTHGAARYLASGYRPVILGSDSSYVVPSGYRTQFQLARLNAPFVQPGDSSHVVHTSRAKAGYCAVFYDAIIDLAQALSLIHISFTLTIADCSGTCSV